MTREQREALVAPLLKELDRIKSLTAQEQVLALAAFVVIPPSPERIVYSVVRQLYLERLDRYIEAMLSIRSGSNWKITIEAARKAAEEVLVWLRPPLEPLTPEKALKMVEAARVNDFETSTDRNLV